MLKDYTLRHFMFLFLCFTSMYAVSQISGTVTINSAAPTTGSNYQTFSDLATVLNASGINGPLTVNVLASSGPYTESVTLNVISGTSSSNTITVNGNGTTLTYSGSSQVSQITLKLNGADYLNFHNLHIEASGQQSVVVCKFDNGADHNVFSACSFSCPAAITLSHTTIDMAASQTIACGNYNSFNKCMIFNGNYGALVGNPGAFAEDQNNEFIACSFINFQSIGLAVTHQENFKISHCSLERTTATTTVNTVIGMRFTYNTGILCDANCIHDLGGITSSSLAYLYGFHCSSNSVTPTSWEVLYKNNIISSTLSNGNIYGIYNYSTGRFYNNTVYVEDQSASAGNTYGLWAVGLNQQDSMYVRNNIFYLNRGGSGNKYGIHTGAAYTAFIPNNNWYYMGLGTGTNFLAALTTNSYSTLSAMQANNLELNGATGNPNFSVTNVCMPVPTNTLFDNGGVNLGVTNDASGAIRNPQHPDFGAFEFNTPACSGVPPANSLSVADPTICAGSVTSLSLTNLDADLGLTYQWMASTTSSAGPWTPISGATTYTYNTDSLNTGTWYQLVMTCMAVGGGSIAPVNSVNLKALMLFPSVNSVICKGGSIFLSASGATTYSWSSGSTYSYTIVSPTVTTTYTVSGIDGATSCSLSAVKTVSVNDCTGLTAIEAMQIKIYPVPAKQELSIEYGNSALKMITLRDLTGRVMQQLNSNEPVTIINLLNLSAGIYFLQINSGEQERILKVVKE